MTEVDKRTEFEKKIDAFLVELEKEFPEDVPDVIRILRFANRNPVGLAAMLKSYSSAVTAQYQGIVNNSKKEVEVMRQETRDIVAIMENQKTRAAYKVFERTLRITDPEEIAEKFLAYEKMEEKYYKLQLELDKANTKAREQEIEKDRLREKFEEKVNSSLESRKKTIAMIKEKRFWSREALLSLLTPKTE